MRFILGLGNDGILREYQWRANEDKNKGVLKEKSIEDAVSSGDGKYFALLSQDQTEISLYQYETCAIIH